MENEKSDYFFIQSNGTPLDKINIRGPQGVLSLSAEDGYNKALLRESNLTGGEVEVLTLVKKYSGYGMATTIADTLDKERPWVSYILNRLVESGHIKKISRGIYVAK